MNLKRTATIVVVCAAVAAWWAAAMTPISREGMGLPSARGAAAELKGAALATEIARLHERLRPDVAPGRSGRNLFAFRAATAPVAQAAPTLLHAPALTETPSASPPPPALKLSGIAEDVAPGGTTRTAIISTTGQLFLAHEGDLVTTRYRIARISPDVVELTDLLDNSVRRLALK